MKKPLKKQKNRSFKLRFYVLKERFHDHDVAVVAAAAVAAAVDAFVVVVVVVFATKQRFLRS